MKDRINVAKLLKDCPCGMELDCAIWDSEAKVFLKRVLNDDFPYPIEVTVKYNNTECTKSFTKYGAYNDLSYCKCVIFPKGRTTWEGFVPPYQFKDGDVITCNNGACTFISIFKEKKPTEKSFKHYCCFVLGYNKFIVGIMHADYANPRFATEEEKEKLFKAIKEHGYIWNPETKTLEKLIKPKFKVGDRIVHKENRKTPFVITEITKQSYKGGAQFEVLIEQQDNFELVPTIVPKFKVGDKIVKRNSACVPILITNVSDEFYYSNTESSIGALSISEQDDWELAPNQLVKPKFRVGDTITNGKTTITIGYIDNEYYYEISRNIANRLFIKFQDEWDLVPNKFDINTLKPFDKVLVRTKTFTPVWTIDFYDGYQPNIGGSFTPFGVTSGKYFQQCIPYEGNEHLRGTTNDCDEFYKTWK